LQSTTGRFGEPSETTPERRVNPRQPVIVDDRLTPAHMPRAAVTGSSPRAIRSLTCGLEDRQSDHPLRQAADRAVDVMPFTV
jgi:hypothetical protein